MFRWLFCPVCGQRVQVEVDSTTYPLIYRIPDHVPAINVNLCQGVVVTVKFDFDRCHRCGCNISVHPSGMCRKCYGEIT